MDPAFSVNRQSPSVISFSFHSSVRYCDSVRTQDNNKPAGGVSANTGVPS